MAITLSGLLAAPALHLVPLTDPGSAAESPIKWAAVTELQDPGPFLGGGEVVLTTGLRQTGAAAQRAFVDAVRDAGALALGYGTGLTHRTVPAAVVLRATELGLPVFEVPYATPFVAITRMIAEAIAEDNVSRLERLLHGHQKLASALLGGPEDRSRGGGAVRGGLRALLRELSRLLATPVALDQYGARVHGPGPEDAQWHAIPIATGLADRCTLFIAEPYQHDPLVDYAKGLVGVELANLARLRESERAAAGQVLEDLAHGILTGQDASMRLQGVGVSPAAAHSVLLVEAMEDPHPLRTLPLPPGRDAVATALVEDRLVLVVETDDGGAAAGELGAFVREAGIAARVGYGGSYAQPSGLRWSYFEALEALRHGGGVNSPSRLSVTSLLLAARDVPLAALATEVLQPLDDFDAAHGADLLSTLRCYLELDGSVGAVADRMGLHRNTVRYRLQQVADISGYDPSTTPDRVQLWLALAARDIHQTPAGAAPGRPRAG